MRYYREEVILVDLTCTAKPGTAGHCRGLHLCESLSAALALAGAASLLARVDWEFPEPALIEALLTCPWLSLARGVASGPNTGVTPPPPPPPPPEPFSASESVVPLLVAPEGVRLRQRESR